MLPLNHFNYYEVSWAHLCTTEYFSAYCKHFKSKYPIDIQKFKILQRLSTFYTQKLKTFFFTKWNICSCSLTENTIEILVQKRFYLSGIDNLCKIYDFWLGLYGSKMAAFWQTINFDSLYSLSLNLNTSDVANLIEYMTISLG